MLLRASSNARMAFLQRFCYEELMHDMAARFREALREDLDRRILEISAYPDDVFGVIPTRELLICALGSVVLPLLAVWLGR